MFFPQKISSHKPTLIFLFIGYLGYYLCRSNLSVAFPLLSTAFSFTNSQLAQIAFISELVYAIGKLMTGPWVDHFEGKGPFLLGLTGAAMANIAFSYANNLMGFILIWCLCRFFLSMGWGGIVKIVGKQEMPANYGRVMGWMALSFQLGGVAASIFAGFLITQGHSWPQLFRYPAFVAFILVVLGFFLIREPQSSSQKQTSSQKKSSVDRPSFFSKDFFAPLLPLFKIPGFWNILQLSFFLTMLRSVFLMWIPKILVDSGFSQCLAAYHSIFFSLLGAGSTLYMGHLSDHHFSRHIRRDRLLSWMIFCLGVNYLCLGAVWMWSTSIQWPVLILLSLSGIFLLGPYSLLGGLFSLDMAGEKAASSCAGWVDGIGYFGGALGLWLTGLGADLWGWSSVFLGMGILTLLAGLCQQILLRRQTFYQNNKREDFMEDSLSATT
jgi:sugar phosphate permease